MIRQSKVALATGIIGMLMAASSLVPLASADSPGQIDGGDIYKIANLTQNSRYEDPASANACDEVEYSILLHNSGFSAVTNVNVAVNLPSSQGTTNVSTATMTYSGGVVNKTTDTATLNISTAQTVTYKSGTAILYDGRGQVIKSLSDSLVNGSVNIGTINGSTTEYVNFKANISCPTPPKPVFTCDNLNIAAESNRTVKITDFATTAKNGATYNHAVITWGDNSSNLSIANPVGQSHQYGADGTYTVSATAHFNVNGEDVTATGPNCVKQVTFKTHVPPTVTPPTTPPTPAAPTALVNTGPGSVAAIFAGTSILGAFLYRRIIARRLARQ